MPDEAEVKVLIVEDDDEDYILARDYLSDSQRLNFQITRARNTAEALSQLGSGHFDVCLIDYMLGETTGLEVFDQARAKGIVVPMVLLTGTGDSDLAEKALRAGISDFLEKARIDSTSLERSIMYVLERRKQQNSMIELNQQLEQRVQQRTEALLAMNAELESFCYSVSHDLRAPLRAIVSTSSILIEDYDQLLPEPAHNLLKSQIASGVRLGTLIDDLLNFIRLRQAVPQRVEVDVTQLAKDICTELGCHNTTKIQPNMVAKADPGMLRTMFQNFMDNALKFTPAGKEPEVEIGQEEGGAFYVRDHGIGFDMRYVKKLFQPFERLHRIEDYPGNGIGLASVKRYAELHGGRAWAESVPGEGSTFYFSVGPNNTSPQ